MQQHEQLYQIILFSISFENGRCDSFTQIRKERLKIKTTDQLVFFEYSRKYSKGECLHECLVFDNFLSKQKCDFRKGYSTHQCLLALLEKWKRAVDNGQIFVSLLTDLSMAFDYLDHELLIAKLNSYGFSLPALRLVNDFYIK